MRSWRIDTPEDTTINLSPSTPIITILPSVEEPEKQKSEKKDEVAGKSQIKEEEVENTPLVSCRAIQYKLYNFSVLFHIKIL